MGRAFEFRKSRKIKRWSSMAKIFTKIVKEITICAKEGGTDPKTNSKLRALIQNAKIKSDFIFNKYGMNCFADDTGLEIDSLNGMPGVYSARFAGKNCNTQENIEKVWDLLTGYKNKKARFKSVFSLNLNGKTFFFEGKIDGEIIFQRKGQNGFGYDSIFIPKGYTKTFAELNLIEKNNISHRSEALKRLIIFLDKQKYL